MTLGQLIKKLRTEKDLSQPVMADYVGIEQSYLSKLENDKSIPSNEVFRSLLCSLSLSAEEFLSLLDKNYIHSHLRQIPDVEKWLQNQRQMQLNSSRRLLLLSCALIVFGCTFFYGGFSKILFSAVEYEYFSRGVVLDGEPFDYFENGAYSITPRDQHFQLRDKLAERYSPELIKTFSRNGDSFVKQVEDGRRHFKINGESKVTRVENNLLQLVGVFLFVAGLMGFVYERRYYQAGKSEAVS